MSGDEHIMLLLELPAMQLEQRVKQEIEENIVLEEERKEEDDEQQTISVDDYIREDDTATLRAEQDLRKGWGERRIREDLIAHGFTREAVEEAMEALAELTGRRVREDVTNRIFARFCVGK